MRSNETPRSSQSGATGSLFRFLRRRPVVCDECGRGQEACEWCEGQKRHDWEAICPICGGWWREQASADERRALDLLAAPLLAGADTRVAEIRQENRGGDVNANDIDWLCDEVLRLRAKLGDAADSVASGGRESVGSAPGPVPDGLYFIPNDDLRNNDVARELAREFPLLWWKAEHADYDERSGYTPEPIVVEAARAMREIWLARQAMAGMKPSSAGDAK